MNYYIYLATLDGVPRYVGFGSGTRKDHVNSGTSHIRKLNEIVLKEEKEFRVEILESDLSKKEASDKEIEYIEKYGREDLGLGTLWNRTNGGIGFRDYHTDETKKKISEHGKKLWSSYTPYRKRQRKETLLASGLSTRFIKGQKSHNAKPVEYNGIVYASLKEAAESNNISAYFARKNVKFL
jgi:hypothetical protein